MARYAVLELTRQHVFKGRNWTTCAYVSAIALKAYDPLGHLRLPTVTYDNTHLSEPSRQPGRAFADIVHSRLDGGISGRLVPLLQSLPGNLKRPAHRCFEPLHVVHHPCDHRWPVFLVVAFKILGGAKPARLLRV
jgi:hypothetical protein